MDNCYVMLMVLSGGLGNAIAQPGQEIEHENNAGQPQWSFKSYSSLHRAASWVHWPVVIVVRQAPFAFALIVKNTTMSKLRAAWSIEKTPNSGLLFTTFQPKESPRLIQEENESPSRNWLTDGIKHICMYLYLGNFYLPTAAAAAVVISLWYRYTANSDNIATPGCQCCGQYSAGGNVGGSQERRKFAAGKWKEVT